MSDSTTQQTPPASSSTPPPDAAAAASLPVLGENWHSMLPDDLKEESSLKTVHDLTGLARSFVHAQKQVGADKIVLPSKHATDLERRAFYHKLGLPEKIDDYKVDAPKDTEINTEFFNSVKAKMHESGILPEQAQNLLGWYINKEKEIIGQRSKLAQGQKDEAKALLEKEWGKAYDQNMERVKQAIKYTGDPELDKFLKENDAGSNPALLKAFVKFSGFLQEDKMHGTGPSNAKAPNDAKVEIGMTMANREHPYHNPSHPNHKIAVQEMLELHEMAYPEKPKE